MPPLPPPPWTLPARALALPRLGVTWCLQFFSSKRALPGKNLLIGQKISEIRSCELGMLFGRWAVAWQLGRWEVGGIPGEGLPQWLARLPGQQPPYLWAGRHLLRTSLSEDCTSLPPLPTICLLCTLPKKTLSALREERNMPGAWRPSNMRL